MKQNFFSKIANNEKLADGLVYFGILGSIACTMISVGAAYLRGMRRGVDIRDDYYYEKEVKEYEDGRK